MESNRDLKHLSFVATSSEKLSQAFVQNGLPAVESVYKMAKTYVVPSIVHPEINRLEETLGATVPPLAAKASDAADRLLHYADQKVDYIVNSADRGIGACKEMHETNLKTFRAAAETYMNFIVKAGDYAAEKITTPASKGVQSARDSLHAAIAKAREATDPDVAVQMAWDAWTIFASYPAVAKLLETAEPATKMGLAAFYGLHDSLVKAPIYKRAIDTGSVTWSYATTTSAYKLGAHYLYPYVQPLADVAIAKVTQSKVINSWVDYWRPAIAV